MLTLYTSLIIESVKFTKNKIPPKKNNCMHVTIMSLLPNLTPLNDRVTIRNRIREKMPVVVSMKKNLRA